MLLKQQGNLCEPSQQSSQWFFKKTVIPTGERKWISIDANPSRGEYLSTQVSKMVTKMIPHHDQEEREQDGSYHWDTVKSVLLKAFCTERSRIIFWQSIHLIHEGSRQKRVEFCLDNKKFLCYLRAIQGHWCYSRKIRNDGIHDCSLLRERVYPCTGGLHGMLRLLWGVDHFREERKTTTTSSIFHTSGSVSLEKRGENSRNRKSENWFEQNSYSRRPSERQDDTQWRIKPCYLRDGHVELIELKTSIQRPPCLHHVFNFTTCICGKLLRPNKNVMDRIKEAFEALKAPYYRTLLLLYYERKWMRSNPWQQNHHKARDALRCATEGDRKYSSIWDGRQNDGVYRAYQLAHKWTESWVRYLDFILHFDISNNAPSWQRERYVNLTHLRSLDSNKHAGPLWERHGHKEAKRALASLQKIRSTTIYLHCGH